MVRYALSLSLSFFSFFSLFSKSVHESRPKIRPGRLYRVESRRAVARKKLWQGSDDISGASGNFSAAGLRAFRVAVRTIDLNRYVKRLRARWYSLCQIG